VAARPLIACAKGVQLSGELIQLPEQPLQLLKWHVAVTEEYCQVWCHQGAVALYSNNVSRQLKAKHVRTHPLITIIDLLTHFLQLWSPSCLFPLRIKHPNHPCGSRPLMTNVGVAACRQLGGAVAAKFLPLQRWHESWLQRCTDSHLEAAKWSEGECRMSLIRSGLPGHPQVLGLQAPSLTGTTQHLINSQRHWDKRRLHRQQQQQVAAREA